MAVPEMAGDYEILQSLCLGGRMMLLGYNSRDKETPYMTCYQQYNLLGEKIFPQAIADISGSFAGAAKSGGGIPGETCRTH